MTLLDTLTTVTTLAARLPEPARECAPASRQSRWRQSRRRQSRWRIPPAAWVLLLLALGVAQMQGRM